MTVKWTQPVAGRWTSELGGIVQGKEGGWYWYPADGSSLRGPWPSLRQAKLAAEEINFVDMSRVV